MLEGKYPPVRVKCTEVIKPLGSKDFAITEGAIGEKGGFDGRVIKSILAHFGVQDSALARLQDYLGSDGSDASLEDESALNAFLICCLTSAALGEEELQTIRGYDRDEFYTTIRRLYHSVRKSVRE